MGASFFKPQIWEPFQPTPLPLVNGTSIVEQPCVLATLTQRYADAANAFLRARAADGAPFILIMSFAHVHAPNFRSPRWANTSARGPVGDATQEVDDAVGQIASGLKATGLDGSTMQWFTSDNGAPLGNDQLGNRPLRDGKTTTWEGGVRVPAAARWPGRIAGGRVTNEVAATYDIFTTALHLAGVPLPADRVIDGADQSPILFGERGKSGHECVFMWYNRTLLAAVRCGDYKAHYFTRNTAHHCPFRAGAHDPPLLFNVLSDKGETQAIAATSAEYKAAMATITAAKAEHLAGLVRGQDQMARGSRYAYALCSDPNSRAKYPQYPNCTITPAGWQDPYTA